MSSWEYRLLAHEGGGENWLEIHEVYYDKNGVIDGCSKDGIPIHGMDVRGIKWNLEKMLLCTKKPILWYGEKFPNVCKITYTCDLCGRNKFQEPHTPHRCGGIYRKHKLQFSINYI